MMQAGQWLRPVAIGLMPVLAVLAIVNAVARPKHANPKEPNYVSWCCSDTRPRDRNSVVDQLAKEPGRQLVLVSYELAAYDTFEWVYNGPDIDASKVVFARDLGDNGKLFAYYKDRTFWRVKVKDGEGRLSRLPGPDRNLTAHTPAVRPSDHTASGTRD